MADTLTEDSVLQKKLNALLFGVRRSVRYHNRRVRYYDRVNKAVTLLSALSGSATIASLLSDLGTEWSIAFATIVAVSSSINLVIGTAQQARLHNDLAKRFLELEKLIILTENPATESILTLTGKRLVIEADEPPPLLVLDSICHNELLRAMGFPRSDFIDIKWYQRMFCHQIDLREHMLKRG